jgi:hypothetical protein
MSPSFGATVVGAYLAPDGDDTRCQESCGPVTVVLLVSVGVVATVSVGVGATVSVGVGATVAVLAAARRRPPPALCPHSAEDVRQQPDDDNDAGHGANTSPVPGRHTHTGTPPMSPRRDPILYPVPDAVAWLQLALPPERTRHRHEPSEALLTGGAGHGVLANPLHFFAAKVTVPPGGEDFGCQAECAVGSLLLDHVGPFSHR